MAVITIPKALREKLGDDGVDGLIQVINEANGENKKSVIELVEDKFEKRVTEVESRINERITEVESRLNERITEVESRLNEKITQVENRLKVEIANVRADLLRWMFIFWAGQIGVIIGLFAFLK